MKTSPTMPCHWHLSTRSWSVCSSSRCCWIRNLREAGKGLQVQEKIIFKNILCSMNAEHWNPLKHKSFMMTDVVFLHVLSWPANYISYLRGAAGVKCFYLIKSYFLRSSLCEKPQIGSAATSRMYSFSVDLLFMWTRHRDTYRWEHQYRWSYLSHFRLQRYCPECCRR